MDGINELDRALAHAHKKVSQRAVDTLTEEGLTHIVHVAEWSKFEPVLADETASVWSDVDAWLGEYGTPNKRIGAVIGFSNAADDFAFRVRWW